ncbi:unnamed protein product [Ilex paraguariensis]
MEILLDKTYPKFPPSVSADVPYIFDLEWSVNLRLKDVVQQFQQHLEKLQDFWSTLDDIDQSLWVVDPKPSHRATSYRQINIGNDCFVMLSINANDPRSLPECRFMGSDPKVNLLRRTWRRNWKGWIKDKLFLENLSLYWRLNFQDLQMSRRMIRKMNVEFVMRNIFPLMMNLELRVGVELIIPVIMMTAVGLSIAFVLGIGYVPSLQQGSHLMFCLGIVHTVQSRLQSISML